METKELCLECLFEIVSSDSHVFGPASGFSRTATRAARPKADPTAAAISVSAGETMTTRTIDAAMTSTTFTIEGRRIVKTLGIARGIIVRSRSVFGTIGAGLQTLVGGDITLFSELCEKTRSDAFMLMLEHAAEVGANAVVGVRYDATEIMNGVTEVLCYGTAVVVAE